MATQWFYQDGGQEQGPIGFRDLVELVRAGRITHVDLVRSSWKSEWQQADSVVGLFHMAGRSEEELARAEHPAPAPPDPEPSFIEPIDALPVPEVEERPSWMKRLFEVGTFRKSRPAEVPILGPAVTATTAAQPMALPAPQETARTNPAAGAPRQALIPELAEYAAPASSISDDWAKTVSAALERTDERAGKRQSSRRAAGFIPAVFRAARIFAPIARFGRSAAFRPAFRIASAFVCANLVALAVEAWSNQEALRFPGRDLESASLRPFPFVGTCSTGEYVFLVFNLMLASGAAAYFAAAWLESRAE
jgi:hypothetical protein